jgi:Spy/CpxP family protein refolding chaperone
MRQRRIALLLLAASPFSFAAAKDPPPQDPIAWGMLSHNTGCVIFEEGHKTTGMFWGVAVTTKTAGKLTVIEAQNYTPSQKVYLETQDVMDDMMRRAQTDHIKYVKIPEKYPPELLEKARAMCKPGE